MDIISYAKLAELSNKQIAQPFSRPFPVHREKIVLVDETNDHTDYTKDATDSTASGSIETATQIDTTTFVANTYPNLKTLTPWLYSKDGLLPYAGSSMVKISATSVGKIIYSKAITAIDLSADGEIAFACYPDLSSSDADTGMVVRLRLYTNYPDTTRYWKSDQFINNTYAKSGTRWQQVCSAAIRAQGYWTKVGDAGAISSINGIGIEVECATESKVARAYISGIYVAKNQLKKGTIIIDFDDALLTQYTEAFNYMWKVKGLKANISACGSTMIAGEHEGIPTMSLAQLKEIAASPWNVTSHSYGNISYNTSTPINVYNDCKANVEWLRENDLGNGYRFAIYVGGGYNGNTENIVSQFHNLARTTWGLKIGMLPALNQYSFASNAMSESKSLSAWNYELNEVEDYKLFRLYHFHSIGDTGWGYTTVAAFRAMIDAIANYDIDVITWSELYDNYIIT